jgi:hypothetical protein
MSMQVLILSYAGGLDSQLPVTLGSDTDLCLLCFPVLSTYLSSWLVQQLHAFYFFNLFYTRSYAAL